MQTLERTETIQEFHRVVNMSSQELERWLDTKESQAVGWKKESDKSVGHHMGGIIIQLLKKKTNDYADEEIAHMQKVVGYVHRHMAQKPVKEEIATSRWRYSLMNWGHDPLK